MSLLSLQNCVIVVGAGPAGLMAAEVIAEAGYKVSVLDAMPSVGRKFLLAGVGGMNITHAEPFVDFAHRYAAAEPFLLPYLTEFSPQHLREWIHGLGIETFVGSSQRVFPRDMKAAPLLRAWLHRLKVQGVEFFSRHRWCGFDEQDQWLFKEADKEMAPLPLQPKAVVLALGGASWKRLGSDAAWVPWLREFGVDVKEFQASNSGFEVTWSDFFKREYAGSPLHGVGIRIKNSKNDWVIKKGEIIVADYGLEGTSIYALSGPLRDIIHQQGFAEIQIDLLPEKSAEQIFEKINKPQGKNSASNFIRKALHLFPVKIALLRELLGANWLADKTQLAQQIKALPMRLQATRPLDEAISCAGGVDWQSVDSHLMLNNLPGVFCAGEMLNWEAPTGGYLLTACFATGRAAGNGVVNYLQRIHSKGVTHE